MSRPEREYPRYAHEAEITFHAPERMVCGRTRNVSRGGLCATVPDDIAVGLEIAIDLQLVFDDRRSEPLRVPARIVWCTQIDDLYQIGVRFLALDHETAGYLTMFLRYLDGQRSTGDEPAPRSIDDRFG